MATALVDIAGQVVDMSTISDMGMQPLNLHLGEGTAVCRANHLSDHPISGCFPLSWGKIPILVGKLACTRSGERP